MDKLISLLNSFFSLPKIAAVSVPGIIAAAAAAILMYPPVPVDVVPILKVTARPLPGHGKKGEPACEIVHGQLSRNDARTSLKEIRSEAVQNQFLLDSVQAQMANCIELETSMKGDEVTENKQNEADIEVLKKDQSDIQTAYQAYEKANSPLRFEYRTKYDKATAAIKDIRNKVLHNEQVIRERDRRLAELTRESNIIADRLKDPGRLRPRQAFDDVIAGLGNHVVALSLFAVAVGLLLNPINRALLSPLYDSLFEQ
jgi:hypothetical protein